MAITKIQSESLNLADDFAFTGTITGAGGVTEFSSYFSNNSQSITSNTTWTTLSSLTYDTSVVIGTGMTLSSGVWSFPSTGLYKLDFGISHNIYPGISQTVGLATSNMQITTDGSSYSDKVSNQGFIYGLRNGTQFSSFGTYTFDVTNISTHKVRFQSYKDTSSSSDFYITSHQFVVQKLGDT